MCCDLFVGVVWVVFGCIAGYDVLSLLFFNLVTYVSGDLLVDMVCFLLWCTY